MMSNRRLQLAAMTAALCVFGCERSEIGRSDAPAASTGIRFLADGAGDGFARAETPGSIRFPDDHGSHPNFRTEWWYFTGNLDAVSGRHFGFELTFFRIAMTSMPVEGPSAWRTGQFWMAHFALTDTASGRFYTAERLSREALGLAGAELSPFRLWVEDWSATGTASAERLAVRLEAAADDAAIELMLESLKPPILQGDRGLDAKGPEPGNASYYYSLPRLEVSGTVETPTGAERVEGLAWMDREWGTSALSPGVEGWDWFALQLSDGRDLMFYRLRRDDGATAAESGGTLVAADGTSTRLDADDVQLEAIDHWVSPRTGVRYPVTWMLTIPERQLELRVEPTLPSQELDLSVRYWEGAVTVGGRAGAAPISGRGYLELAGYRRAAER
jgi:predicted secreted hydrolase